MTFRDHFSKQSEVYRIGRPTYPDELFEFLAKLSPSLQLCWDCATGSGQAAISLAKHFKRVIATDASKKQLESAMLRDNIDYRLAQAEQSGLESHSADLITVATAAHWFEHDKFYAETKRVARPNGILAVWAYSEARISPEIDELMEWFMYDYLLNYWPDGRWYVRNSYDNLPFPFEQIETPQFYCKFQWSREHWYNYVKSWSAYNNYLQKNAEDPLAVLQKRLNALWPETKEKEVVWKLNLKCARLE